ncbi:MAG: hypothetical protein KatS3mg011_0478 [Acidimicrobiia bacterium]|nr:MAG: hypothetical protein KatS3mg011_0478 [Acidimicrobiia bacterium]
MAQAGFDPGSASTEPAEPPPRPAQGLEVLAPALPRTPSPPAVAPIPPPDPVDEAWRTYPHTVDLRFAVSPPRPDAFPPLPPDSGEGRRIVYANSAQRVWLVDDLNRVVDSYPVSGRRGVPRPGTYRVYSKSELAWAGHDGITMKHMVRFARGRSLAIGFHSIPVTASGRPIQTEEDLGSFRSAGCVRQAPDKALQLYLFADVGTTVVVLP